MTDDAKGMPERVWVCDSVRAAVRGLHAERIPWRYDPTATDATEYILASRFTALEAENERLREALEEYACLGEPVHMSDCALHNGPAMPVGPCDCGAINEGNR